MERLLKNKKIFIAGGSSGIGLAVAKSAYKLGARIIIVSRSVEKKRDFLKNELGDDTELFEADLNSEESIQRLAGNNFNVDHLVIAVRPEIKPAPFESLDFTEAKKAFDTKFWGALKLIQLLKNGINPGGSIILTSGISGEKIYKNGLVMGVINGALETLCRALAAELAPLRINIVSPGFIAPKPPETEEFAKGFPLGRIGSPEEIASQYIHLMLSTYTTGTSIVADGGARLL